VILACKSRSETEPIVEEIKEVTGNKLVEFMELDTSSMHSVSNFVNEFKKRDLPLHILINNAGKNVGGISVDGYQLNMATNYLGHFLLTTSLLNILERSTSSRVVHVSSDAYRAFGGRANSIDEEFLKKEDKFFLSFATFSASKFCQVAFSNSLARKYGYLGIYSVSLDPGFVVTDILRESVMKWTEMLEKTPEPGSLTTLHCATAPLENGAFYQDSKVRPIIPAARDEKFQEHLWKLSENLCSQALKRK